MAPVAAEQVAAGEQRVGAELSSAQALALDAAQYARDNGITEREALRALRAQEQAVAAIDRVAQAAGSRFDGAWIEHGAEVRGHVRLTGPAIASVDQLAAGTGQVEIEWTDVPVMAIMRRQADAASAALADSAEVVGVGVDVAQAEIVIWVDETRVPQNREDVARDFSAENAEASGVSTPLADVREAVERAGIPTRVEWAGGADQDQQRGGVSRTDCTVGFSIYWTSTGSRGVASAAHCGEPAGDQGQLYSLTWNGTPTYQLRWVSEQYDQSGDVEVLTMASHTPQPNFFGQSAVTPTATTGTGTAYQGQYLCHRGKTSGYNCGTVVTTSYAPSSSLCPGGACAAVFVRVQGINLLCQGGDSGGPWFISGAAYGIHKGGSDPRTCFFTPIARLANLGARILT